MPPKRTQLKRDSIEQEGRVLLAIETFQKQENTSIREAARRFNIADRTLRPRLAGRPQRQNTRANSHKLTQNEEESLPQWILFMDRRGAAPRPEHV